MLPQYCSKVLMQHVNMTRHHAAASSDLLIQECHGGSVIAGTALRHLCIPQAIMLLQVGNCHVV